MDKKQLEKLAREPNEQDWFDFKAKLNLYQADGKLAERQRDELIKDILGLANGNSHTIPKTKYLIIGADDKSFDEKGLRVLHNVDYKVPSQSDLAKWLKDVCSPAVVGLDCETVQFNNCNLFIITIPPTFDLHETTRELVTPSCTFQKHTVFMRQDEHTVTASVRDGITIQQLKHLHRQEIANPPSTLIGAIAGGVATFIISSAKAKAAQVQPPIPEAFLVVFFTFFGIFFGAFIGWFSKQWNEIRYDWRYMTWQSKVIVSSFVIFMIVVYFILFR